MPGDVDLLVVGGPTHMHGLTTAMSRKMAASAGKEDAAHVEPGASEQPGLREWLRDLEARGIKAAAFDTRGDARAALTGSAARGIARRLRRRGCEVIDSQSFLVADAEDPLEDGELDRAREWGASLACGAVSSQVATELARKRLVLARADSRHEEVGQRHDRRRCLPPQPTDVRRLRSGTAMVRERDADGRRPVGDGPQPLGLLVAEAVRVERVDDDQVEPAADRAGQLALELEDLADRHVLRQRDADVAGLRRIAEEVTEFPRLRADRAQGRNLPDCAGQRACRARARSTGHRR